MANSTAIRIVAVTDAAEPFYLGMTVSGSILKLTADSGEPLGLELGDFMITPQGGYAVKLVAGEDLAKGNIVSIRQTGGADSNVWKSGNTNTPNDMPVGIVYAAAVAGASVWIVTSGKAEVLPLTIQTAVRGYVIFVGGEIGRADQSNVAPASEHWRECGHWLASGTAPGVLTLAIIHFN